MSRITARQSLTTALLGLTALLGACVDGAAQNTLASGGSASAGSSSVANAGASGSGVVGASAGTAGTGAPVSCLAPQTSCNGACVDLTSNANCGSCGKACAAGQACTAGTCQGCAASLTVCNDACTDTQTSSDHCGGCSQPCATGATCSGGKCGCAMGQALCNDVCADLQESETNCGSCGDACSTGQSCSSGTCITDAGADGCSGPALGVTLSQVAAYQTVKVPVMDAGAEIGTAKRTTDLVTGRPTLFRIGVTVDAGFAARTLSARVTVNKGDSATQFFGKAMISKTSVDTEPASTFQVLVPADQITVDTRYSVELVECGTGSGTAKAARFPATSDIELGARRTGILKVKLFPLLANGKAPDTSDTALAVYRQQLLAMYPIDSVELTVGEQLSIAFPVDWSGTLNQMRTKRSNDKPAADVYYYGLLKPQDTFSQFCGGGCTTGIGYVGEQNSASFRAALGVGFADRTSAQTMAHELGHNHGRNHAPCVPNGGSISGVDGNYPFPDGRTGILGYDSRTKVLLPEKGTDLMGYCSNVWLSEYTYGGILDRVALVNGNNGSQAKALDPAALHPWRVLLIDSHGARWTDPIREPQEAEGRPIVARALDAAGAQLEELTLYRTDISEGGGAVFWVPEPHPNWVTLDIPAVTRVAF